MPQVPLLSGRAPNLRPLSFFFSFFFFAELSWVWAFLGDEDFLHRRFPRRLLGAGVVRRTTRSKKAIPGFTSTLRFSPDSDAPDEGTRPFLTLFPLHSLPEMIFSRVPELSDQSAEP